MSVESVVQTIRLLVIDDEVIVGKRLKQIFDKMGYEVEVRTDGASAIELMEQKKFDIVITDLKMDGMDGMQVLSRVRELNPATKVIIITGYAQLETSQQAFREGVFDFIAKPFRLDELKQVILRAIKEQHVPGNRVQN
ncbi:MAG: response regulator [Desulfobulbaceae bacterium]|nr:response regulator [Desulfobulbaceae bacterium]